MKMGAYLILLDPHGEKHSVVLEGGMVTVPGLGTFDVEKLRASIGRVVRVGSRPFMVLEPSLRDLNDTLLRGPQVLTPKDIASLRFELDLAPGSRVVEAGTGSGALTLALARAAGPSGRVYSYDLRADLQDVARKNAHRAGLEEAIEFRAGDVREAIDERGVDGVVLDLPDPWVAVPAAWEALRPCGTLATFSPNMEQVKETAAAIRKRPFVETRTIELIEREMEVREIGMRPSFAPLGHTGYLTFARKVLDTF